jgi:hypothetical protein
LPGSCCAKPIARIIKVADVEAGLVGLDQALRNAYVSGISNKDEIKQELLRSIRDFGNYVSPTREDDYKQALLREYRDYVANLEREASQKKAQTQKR